MFNSLSIAKQLEAAGVPRAQAEAHVQILSDVVENEIATKRDLKELEAATKRDLKELEAATKRDLKELEAATKRDLKELEAATKRDLKELEQHLVIKICGIVGAMITFSIALTAALNKLL